MNLETLRFNVLVRNAAGREEVVPVVARNGTVAAGRAVRALEGRTGEKWYAVKADPR